MDFGRYLGSNFLRRLQLSEKVSGEVRGDTESSGDDGRMTTKDIK